MSKWSHEVKFLEDLQNEEALTTFTSICYKVLSAPTGWMGSCMQIDTAVALRFGGLGWIQSNYLNLWFYFQTLDQTICDEDIEGVKKSSKPRSAAVNQTLPTDSDWKKKSNKRWRPQLWPPDQAAAVRLPFRLMGGVKVPEALDHQIKRCNAALIKNKLQLVCLSFFILKINVALCSRRTHPFFWETRPDVVVSRQKH